MQYAKDACMLHMLNSKLSFFHSLSPWLYHVQIGAIFCYIIKVMIHQLDSSFYEAEFIVEAEELLQQCETITGVHVQRMGNFYGLYPKTCKRMLLCQQQKPKLMELLFL